MRLTTAFLVGLAFASRLHGQETEGAATGATRGPDGNGLAGVRVEARGERLLGVRSATSNDRGFYLLPNLPPGSGYELTARLDGYHTVVTEGVRVPLGQRVTVDFLLLPAVEESLTVSASRPPAIDFSSAGGATNITAAEFETLPTTRGYQRLTTLAPGVSLAAGEIDARLESSPSIGGSSPPENSYVIEGLSVTDPLLGTSGANLTMNFVEEVQVLTGGVSAEYGRSTGGIINVITKSGGNRFGGEIFAYYQAAEWSAQSLRRAFRGSSTLANGEERGDLGFAVGGPVVRDRLWFFAAYDPTRGTTFVRDFTDPLGSGVFVEEEHEKTLRSDLYAGKLTLQLARGHDLVLTGFGDPTRENGWLGAAASDPPVALRKRETGGDNGALRYSGTLSSHWLVEARAGRHEQAFKVAADTELGRRVPKQQDARTGYSHGGFAGVSEEEGSRQSYVLKATGLVGRHEWRGGLDLDRNRWQQDYDYGPFTFVPGRRRTFMVHQQLRTLTLGRNDNEAAFLEDSLRMGSVQVNLGLRYERQTVSSTGGVAVATAAEDGGVLPREVPEFRFGPDWAPRLAAIWDVGGRGRAKVYASAGRYFESFPLASTLFTLAGSQVVYTEFESSPPHTSADWFNPLGSPLGPEWYTVYHEEVTVGPGALDASTRTPFVHEWALGTELAWREHWTLGARLVERRLGRAVEDFGVFADPQDPNALTGLVSGNPGDGAFGRDYRRSERRYQAFESTLERRASGPWWIRASLVLARERGDYEGLYQSNNKLLYPNLGTVYDLPAMQVNAFGKLPGDRPFELKVHSSYRSPIGLTLSEAFNLAAGTPISKLGPELYNSNGFDSVLFLEPRGSAGRTPTVWNLDLHADYILPWKPREGCRVALILDVFNATGNHQVLAVDNDYVYVGMPGFEAWEDPANLDSYGNPSYDPALPHSEFFGTPTVYSAPRRFQVGVKLSF